MKHQRIGLFGGSFNPIHCGHISIARNILNKVKLDQIWFVVSPHNPLKSDNTLLPDHLRLELVKTALQSEANMIACDYEFTLPKPSYTWNTLQQLSQDYPDNVFTLLIGEDNWTCFPKWYCYEQILNNYDIIIYPRNNSLTISEKLPENIRLINTDLLDISSTQIRNFVKNNRPIDGMVPECIKQKVLMLYK